MKFKHFLFATVLAVVAHAAFATSTSTSVSGNSGYNFTVSGSMPTLTDLGSFAAGTYSITATGTVDLVGNGTFTMNPDGTPFTPVTASGYSYFNPGGSYSADGKFGFAGSAFKIGALVGTFSVTPGASDWFSIGAASLLTLGTASHIYAAVNETYSVNNTGAFLVSVTAVPEPETYAMFLAGLGLMGFMSRRRSIK